MGGPRATWGVTAVTIRNVCSNGQAAAHQATGERANVVRSEIRLAAIN